MTNNFVDVSREAQLLLAHAAFHKNFKDQDNLNRLRKALLHNEEASDQIEQDYEKFLERRCKQEPIQYITNEAWFYTLPVPLFVDEHVLIPRNDTEIVVETVLNHCVKNRELPVKILDLGTGSGAILLSLLYSLPSATGVGFDISKSALEVAEMNASKVLGKSSNKCTLVQGDMLKSIDEVLKYGPFDIIVSNPPYIRTDVVSTLDEEVLKEPHHALDGGVSGLNFYERIYELIREDADKHKLLKKGGHVVLEIGFDQREQVTALFTNQDALLRHVCSVKDYGNNDRAVCFAAM